MKDSRMIAAIIRKTAADRGVTVTAMLNDLDMSLGTLSYMSKSFPKVNTIMKIADYLECSVDYLLGRGDNLCDRETVVCNHNGRIVKKELSKVQTEFVKNLIMSLAEYND